MLMMQQPPKSPAQRLLRAPSIASLMWAILLFLVCLGLLHPRYAINDDLKIISILAGYPAGNPAPFPIFSNVALGLVLEPLYSLHTAINWEIMLFIGTDFLAVWGLLYILFWGAVQTRYKLIGACIILASASYFALNITFTNVAGLACFAGLTLMLATARSARTHWMATGSGIALVFMGSLIRIEMLALTIPVILAGLPFIYRSLRLTNLLLVFGCAGLAVFAGYAFDRLYVRAYPDWNTYYFYNKTAQQLEDAHRLENAGTRIAHISWSGNDQELFARSFFPDAKIYSIDRIQYLIAHVPGTAGDPLTAAQIFLRRLTAPALLPASLMIVALCLVALASRPSGAKMLGQAAIMLVSLAENFFLAWFYKNPDWVLFCSVANTVMLEVLVLYWTGSVDDTAATRSPESRPVQLAYYGFVPVMLILLGMTSYQAIVLSNQNLYRQEAYRQLLADIGRLQAEGKLAPDAIIISPSHGIPWEWSNPLRVEFPGIPVLDLGWITFSPFYDGALQHYDLQPLPEALYQKSNVYVMTKQIFKSYLARYYEEHLHITVDFQPIYTIPSAYHAVEYEDTQLYKVVLVK
jgi:hypothetical protein